MLNTSLSNCPAANIFIPYLIDDSSSNLRSSNDDDMT